MQDTAGTKDHAGVQDWEAVLTKVGEDLTVPSVLTQLPTLPTRSHCLEYSQNIVPPTLTIAHLVSIQTLLCLRGKRNQVQENTGKYVHVS